MQILRGAVLAVLALGAHGFRAVRRHAKRSEIVEQSAQARVTPALYPETEGKCQILQAFKDLDCTNDFIFEPIQSCDVETAYDKACIGSRRWDEIRFQTQIVTTRYEYTSLTRSLTSVSGGVLFVKVTVGFEYMKRSKVSKQSMAWFISAVGKSEERFVNRSQNLRLKADVAWELFSNPTGFLNRYGSQFVASYNYGGAWTGSFTLSARQSETVRSLRTFAKIEVNLLFFSVSASVDFTVKWANSGGELNLTGDAEWRGGAPGLTLDTSSPLAFGESFNAWQATWRDYPVPLSMIVKPWMHSGEITEYVMWMNDDDFQKFAMYHPITETFSEVFSEERTKFLMAKESAIQALEWNTVKGKSPQSCVQGIKTNATSKLDAIDGFKEWHVLERQQEYQKGNLTWFNGDELLDAFDECTLNLN